MRVFLGIENLKLFQKLKIFKRILILIKAPLNFLIDVFNKNQRLVNAV